MRKKNQANWKCNLKKKKYKIKTKSLFLKGLSCYHHQNLLSHAQQALPQVRWQARWTVSQSNEFLFVVIESMVADNFIQVVWSLHQNPAQNLGLQFRGKGVYNWSNFRLTWKFRTPGAPTLNDTCRPSIERPVWWGGASTLSSS